MHACLPGVCPCPFLPQTLHAEVPRPAKKTTCSSAERTSTSPQTRTSISQLFCMRRGVLTAVLVLACASGVEAEPPPSLQWCDCKSPFKFCENYGNMFPYTTSGSPSCKECGSGYYFKYNSENHAEQNPKTGMGLNKMIDTQKRPNAVDANTQSMHSHFRGADKAKYTCVRYKESPGLFGSGSRSSSDQNCEEAAQTGWTPGPVYQTCQHCPMHTLINSRTDLTVHSTRCFTSCEIAHSEMSTLAGEYKEALLGQSTEGWYTQSTTSTPFTSNDESDLWHAIVDFAVNDEESRWENHRSYIDFVLQKHPQASFTRTNLMTRLPPPQRQCKVCARGKSMVAGRPTTTICRDLLNQGQRQLIKQQSRCRKCAEGLLCTPNEFQTCEISWLDPTGPCFEFSSNYECVPCPKGTMQVNRPPDTENKDYTFMDPANGFHGLWTFRQLRCQPCQINTYQDNTGMTSCKTCPSNEYVLSTSERYDWKEKGITLGEYIFRESSTHLFTTCKKCPPGTFLQEQCTSQEPIPKEFKFNFLTGDPTLDVTFKLPVMYPACCKPCLHNTLSSKEGARFTCTPTASPTKAPFGQIEAFHQCPTRTQKQYCRAGEARVQSQPSPVESPCADLYFPESWHTCVPCLQTERIQDGKCAKCNRKTPTFSSIGEFWQDQNAQCEQCDSCSYLQITFSLRAFGWETHKPYTDYIDTFYKDREQYQEQYAWDSRWSYLHVQAICTPLPHRKIVWQNNAWEIEGQGDYYKADASNDKQELGMMHEKAVVQKFHSMWYNQIVNRGKVCEYKHCRDFCSVFRYQYSNGCGAMLPEHIWVEYTRNNKSSTASYLDFKNLLPQQQHDQVSILHQGKCVECTVCDAGSYNRGCNEWSEGKNPEGECNPCLDKCSDPKTFLWHQDALRACKPPNSLKVKVQYDYVCKACPTWIRKDNRIFAVLGCGTENEYSYFTYDATKGNIPAQISFADLKKMSHVTQNNQAIERQFLGVPLEAHYCPRGYFFEESQTCQLAKANFVLKDMQGVEHGVDQYNFMCCKQCIHCDPAKNKRVKGLWKECDGTSLKDTEVIGCVSKCQSGYFSTSENASNTECQKCTTCPPSS